MTGVAQASTITFCACQTYCCNGSAGSNGRVMTEGAQTPKSELPRSEMCIAWSAAKSQEGSQTCGRSLLLVRQLLISLRQS